jgi:hypothetical protein
MQKLLKNFYFQLVTVKNKPELSVNGLILISAMTYAFSGPGIWFPEGMDFFLFQHLQQYTKTTFSAAYQILSKPKLKAYQPHSCSEEFKNSCNYTLISRRLHGPVLN